eukprot:3677319-Amphidinium_carterae.1
MPLITGGSAPDSSAKAKPKYSEKRQETAESASKAATGPDTRRPWTQGQRAMRRAHVLLQP